MRKLGIKHIEHIAFSLAQELLSFDEPIPDYSTRYPNMLESCLATPFQWFSGRPLYKGIVAKASMLFYLMIKNHPFQNGNKRIAITTLLVFLDLNGRWLQVGLKEFYGFSIGVASSQAKDKDKALLEIKAFIKGHMIERRGRSIKQ